MYIASRKSLRHIWPALPLLLAFAGFSQNNSVQDNPAWKSKRIAEWSDDDAKQFLADSPWVKNFTPSLAPAQSEPSPRRGMGMGGIGMGGIGLGMPGMGRRMGGYPGGGYPPAQPMSASPEDLPKLTLRWESAMPVRTAELKIRDDNAPVLDPDHYAIAVYGLPDYYLKGDSKTVADQLKKDVTLRRDGRKNIKPSGVQVLDKPAGRVVVYLFSTSNEITRDDHRVEFNAKIGRLDLTQSFFLDDMVWDGKREL